MVDVDHMMRRVKCNSATQYIRKVESDHFCDAIQRIAGQETKYRST